MFKNKRRKSRYILGTLIMDPRIKCFLVANLSSEWKRFACDSGFDKAVIDSIDFDKHNDEIKMDELLQKLVLENPSDFMSVIEKSLTQMGRTDVLNEMQMFRKCNPFFYALHVFIASLQFKKNNFIIHYLITLS